MKPRFSFKGINRCFVAFGCFLLLGFIAADKPKIKLWLIGDSTMSVKDVKAYPETGWGMPFRYFFDSTVLIDNRAKNGRSTKTFIAEGLWQPVADNLNAGDYVLIQFGHNDEVSTKASYATEKEFKDYLNRFIQETKAKKAHPVLITPVARRKFDSLNNIVETHEVYAAIVRSVAKAANVPLIDLAEKSKIVLQQMGPENAKLLFLHLAPGEHPNYPTGKIDDTHFNELGARKMAQLVLNDIKMLKLELVEKIVKPKS